MNEQLKSSLQKIAKEKFGDNLVEISVDYEGEDQISVECLLKFNEELTDEKIMELARKEMDFKLAILKELAELDENRALFSGVRFAEQKAA